MHTRKSSCPYIYNMQHIMNFSSISAKNISIYELEKHTRKTEWWSPWKTCFCWTLRTSSLDKNAVTKHQEKTMSACRDLIWWLEMEILEGKRGWEKILKNRKVKTWKVGQGRSLPTDIVERDCGGLPMDVLTVREKRTFRLRAWGCHLAVTRFYFYGCRWTDKR